MTHYGETIKAYRQLKGISQTALAKAINETQSKLSYYETNPDGAPIRKIEAICDYLGIPLSEFFSAHNKDSKEYVPPEWHILGIKIMEMNDDWKNEVIGLITQQVALFESMQKSGMLSTEQMTQEEAIRGMEEYQKNKKPR